MYKCTYPNCGHPGHNSQSGLWHHMKTCIHRNVGTSEEIEADRKRLRKRAGFECALCSEAFVTKKGFICHMFDEHGITKCSARDCTEEFGNFADWKTHRDAEHRNDFDSGSITAQLEKKAASKSQEIDHLSDSDQGYHYEQYNPPVIDKDGFLTFPWTSRKPMPPGSFNPDEFTYADATAASANLSRGHASTSRSQNQVNNSAGGNLETNGEHISFAKKGATVPISILKKGNRQAPRSPPTPRPRTRPTTAKQNFAEKVFARMAEERKNDPLPIRRPLPNFNDDDSDSSFGNQNSSSEDGSGSGSESDSDEEGVDGEPAAKRKKLSGLESLKRVDLMGNEYYHHPDNSDSDENEGFRYHGPSKPEDAEDAEERARFRRVLNRSKLLRDYYGNMSFEKAYKLWNPAWEVGPDHPDTSNKDFDTNLSFPPRKSAAEIAAAAATAALNKAAENRQHNLIYPPPMREVRMEFMTNPKVPKTWDVISYREELAAEKKAKEEAVAAKAGIPQAKLKVAAKVAFATPATTCGGNGAVAPAVKRSRKVGSRSKKLPPGKPKRQYKWKDESRKNKGWKIDAKAKVEDEEGAEEGDDEDDEDDS